MKAALAKSDDTAAGIEFIRRTYGRTLSSHDFSADRARLKRNNQRALDRLTATPLPPKPIIPAQPSGTELAVQLQTLIGRHSLAEVVRTIDLIVALNAFPP